MSCQNIDVRGAKSNIVIEKDTVLNVNMTFKDSDGSIIDISQYTDIQFIIQTETPVIFSLDDGDMSIANNVLTLDFEVASNAGEYDYQLLMINATGATQYMYGKIKVT